MYPSLAALNLVKVGHIFTFAPINSHKRAPRVVWHTQVAAIVVGHIVSVYIAHLQALALFPDRRTAVISQLPVLLLMVLFTAVGLWILSLPLNSGEIGG